MHTPLNTRNAAMFLGALIYAALRAGALFDVLDRLFPGLQKSSPLSFETLSAVVQGVSLVLLVTGIESVVLSWVTRRIRGDWIYLSSSGNWGHVRIKLKDSKLRYKVDLYLKKEDLLRVIEEHKPGTSIGSGYDKMTLFTGDAFYAWYYVPQTGKYPERQGMLTLTQTNDENRWAAWWERTGALRQSQTDLKGAMARVMLLDQRSPAGEFEFFVRKKTFLRHKELFNAVETQ
jgi:hypothetical protein